jgi:hypothetical protein
MNVINKLKVGSDIKLSCGHLVDVDEKYIDRSNFEWVYTVTYSNSDYLLVQFALEEGNFILSSYESIKIENRK